MSISFELKEISSNGAPNTFEVFPAVGSESKMKVRGMEEEV